ncbi:potassium-transporting ATPase subunit F [Neobacillus fumarioli]
MGLISIAMIIYLSYVLMKPEKF